MKYFLFLFLLAFGSLKSGSRIVEKTVASVGEKTFLLSDLNLFRNHLRDGLVGDSILFKAFPKKTLLKNKNKRLEFMIFQEMVSQILRERGGTLSPKDFIKNGKVKLTRNKKGRLTASEKKLSKKISLGGKEKDFWNRVDSYAANDSFLSQEVVSKITISDNEINAHHFNKEGRNLFKEFEYEFDSVSFLNNKKGQKKMKKFVKSFSTSSFHKIAKKQKIKIKSSQLKGPEINPIMYKSLKNLSVSQVSKPIFIGPNIYVLKLKWKTPSLSFSDQKKEIKIQRYLFETELKKELKKWLEKQKISFPIKIHSV